jgi:hypothetical protein
MSVTSHLSTVTSAQASWDGEGRSASIVQAIKTWKENLLPSDIRPSPPLEPRAHPVFEAPEPTIEETRELLADPPMRAAVMNAIEGDPHHNRFLLDLITIAGVLSFVAPTLRWFVDQIDRFLEAVHLILMARPEVRYYYPNQRFPHPPTPPRRNATPGPAPRDSPPPPITTIERQESEDPNNFPIPPTPAPKQERSPIVVPWPAACPTPWTSI